VPWGAPEQFQKPWKKAIDSFQSALRDRQEALGAIVARLQTEGRLKFEDLEERGFFEVELPNRASVLRKVAPTLIQPFKQNGWLTRDLNPDNGGGLLDTILKEAVGPKKTEAFAENFFRKEELEFRRIWEGHFSAVGLAPERSSAVFNLAKANRELVEAQPSDTAVTATTVVAAPIAAT
jgi:hypothetical protein